MSITQPFSKPWTSNLAWKFIKITTNQNGSRCRSQPMTYYQVLYLEHYNKKKDPVEKYKTNLDQASVPSLKNYWPDLISKFCHSNITNNLLESDITNNLLESEPFNTVQNFHFQVEIRVSPLLSSSIKPMTALNTLQIISALPHE